MKEEYIRFRLSKRRKEKIQAYAAMREKTITSILEDLIDLLPDVYSSDQNSTIPNLPSSKD